MKTRPHFVVICVISLQILVIASLVPTAKSLFRDGYSLPVNRKNVSNASSHENKIRSSTENLRRYDNTMPSNDGIDENERTHDVDEEEGLVFEGTFNYQSDIISIPTAVMSAPATDLNEFFSDPKNRDLAIKGGGNPCKNIPLTPELHDEWTIQSKVVNSTPPNGNKNDDCRNEEVLAVYSEVPIVPGLSLRAISYTGCKTMKEPTSALPYYEFTLLNESYQPVGKKAMTWIFDKITGNKKDKAKSGKDSKHIDILPGKKNDPQVTTDVNTRKTYALSRVTLEPFPQDGGCKICYYGHVKLTLSKKFLHMLPLPTKVVQSKVNNSIRKQLERECTRSIEKFAGALNRWNERDLSSSADTQ